MSQAVGTVSELWRYPIKSVGGEQLSRAEVGTRGILGDRMWAVEDEQGKFGSGKSTRRFRQMNGLLEFSSFYDDLQDAPVLVFPDGSKQRATSPEAVAALQRKTGINQLSVTPERDISHFDEGAIHLLTTSTAALLDEKYGGNVSFRRLRNNITLETGAVPQHLEEEWVGRQLRVGETLVLEIAYLMPRCVMVNMAQRDLPEQPGILKTIARINSDVCLGALATVIQPGEIKLGDIARLI